MRLLILSLACLMMVVRAPVVGAQPSGVPQRAVLHPMIALGDSLLEAGVRGAARQAYERALDRDPLTAHLRLGAMDLEEDELKSARRHFDDALNNDPGNLEAHYYRAIVLRQLGLSKPAIAHAIPLLKNMLEWHKAEQSFQVVLQRDSLYRDVVYQYAVFQRYQAEYREAIRLGHRQVALRPDLVEPQVGLFRLYRFFHDNRRRGEVRRWLVEQGTDHARYTLGEWYRRREHWAEADSVFHSLLDGPLAISRQPVYLALARVAYAREHNEEAERYVRRAIEEIRSPVDAALVFEDVKYIVTDEEYEAYLHLQTNEERIAYFRAFWRKRDPMPAAPLNARLAEHYRRLRFAEKHFQFDGFRRRSFALDPFAELVFPQAFWLNREFNDKGLVYIRHGPPDLAIETLGAPNEIDLNESWRYDESGLIFHFMIDPETGSDNEWRLAARLTDTRMLRQRQPLGGVYVKLYERYRNAGTTALSEYQLQAELGRQSRAHVLRGLTTDRHTWSESVRSIEVPMQIAAFRGERGRSEVMLAYQLPIDEVERATKQPVDSLEIETGFALYTLGWSAVAMQAGSGLVGAGRREGLPPLGAFSHQAQPGRYHMAFHVRLPATHMVASVRDTVTVPSFDADTLTMSDVAAAHRIAPGATGPFIRHGRSIVPNPTHRFEVNDPVHLYFEIYGLEPNAVGATSFSVEYTLRPDRRRGGLLGLFRRSDRPELTLSARRAGDGDTSLEQAELDISGVDPGAYALVVKVTDLTSGETTRRTLPLRLDKAGSR